MDQTEKVFERLKTGEQWDSVLNESGKSTFYKAVNHFFTWARPQVKTLQNSIKENEDKLTDLNRKNTQLNSEIASKEAVNTKLEEKRLLTEKKYEEVSTRVTSTQKRLEELDSGLTKLKEKGITREVVEAITTSDISSPDELIKRIDTVEKHEAEKRNYEGLKKTNLVG